jgi:CRP-like cAMP-binding protein
MRIDDNGQSEASIDPDELKALCQEVSFAAGDILRLKDQHYKNMYLLTDGEVQITLAKKNGPPTLLRRGRGSPIGEISFLTGRPATALVTAMTPVKALAIDDAIMARIESERPDFAAHLYQQLANVAEGRQSFNLTFLADDAAAQGGSESILEVRLCRNSEMLHEAQRIRYEVYCEELGRTSPFADPVRRVIADELDTFAHVLLAFEGDRPVGTLRMNSAREGALGAIEQIYGMPATPDHPTHTGVCTKFIVRKAHRRGKGSFRLMASSMTMGRQYDIRKCYIDCIPQLLPFYMSLGFRQSAPAFLHRENGRSIPLSLDMDRYAERIARLTGFVLR